MSARDYTPRFKTVTPKKERKPYRYVKKATGEKGVFSEILAERFKNEEYFSEVSKERIYDPTEINFAHIIPKAQNKYPLFKLRKDNIMLVTWDEHTLWDKGLRSELRNDKRWDWVFEKEEQLKQEYEQLKKDAA